MRHLERRPSGGLARRLPWLLACIALVRRIVDIVALLRCRAWIARRQRAGGPEQDAAITVVVPLLDETAIVDEMVAHWAAVVARCDGVEVALVTTAKEGDGAGTTRAALVRAREAFDATSSISLFHCETPHRFREAQLNLVVRHLLEREPAPERCWVGVYNADSKPPPEVFQELRRTVGSEGSSVRAYQQLVQYHRPVGRPSRWYMGSFALAQTWWTFTRYFARSRKGSRNLPLARLASYSTFGHGEFVRLDLLAEINGFPGYVYADGLLLGWELRAAREPIGLLSTLEWAETPRSLSQVVVQHRAWMRGLLNARAAIFSRRGAAGAGGLSDAGREALTWSNTLKPVAWGVRAAGAVGALLATAVLRWPSPAAACLGIGLAYELIPAVAAPLFFAPSHAAGLPTHVTRDRWPALIAGSPLVLFVDGIGFWPALADHLFRRQSPPKKTPR